MSKLEKRARELARSAVASFGCDSPTCDTVEGLCPTCKQRLTEIAAAMVKLAREHAERALKLYIENGQQGWDYDSVIEQALREAENNE